MSKYPLYDQLKNTLESGGVGTPAIKAPGWGTNYYIDEAGNKINKNPEIDIYFDKQGKTQYFGKPQIDWGKVEFGQDPFNTPGALLGEETILNYPTGTGIPTGTPTTSPTAVSVSTPSELPTNYVGQSIGGLANYLQTSNMPFGTMKNMGGTISPEVKAWRGKFNWE